MAVKKKELETKEKDSSKIKLTGRELFMRDKTLNDSDLTFDEGKYSFESTNKLLLNSHTFSVFKCQEISITLPKLSILGEDAVPIDESLFEDLEDLDINEEDED